MPRKAAKKERPGLTAKISISVERSDLAMLRRRASERYDGNLSAVLAEGISYIREQEGREALVRWLGAAGQATPEEQAAIEAEWHQPLPPPPKRARKR